MRLQRVEVHAHSQPISIAFSEAHVHRFAIVQHHAGVQLVGQPVAQPSVAVIEITMQFSCDSIPVCSGVYAAQLLKLETVLTKHSHLKLFNAGITGVELGHLDAVAIYHLVNHSLLSYTAVYHKRMDKLNNILVSVVTEYTECHGIFRSQGLSEICRLSGYRGVAFTGIERYVERSTPWLKIHHLPQGIGKLHAEFDPGMVSMVDDLIGGDELDLMFCFLEWWMWQYLSKTRARSKQSAAFLHCYIAACLDHAQRFKPWYLQNLQQEVGHKIDQEQRMLSEVDRLLVASSSVVADLVRLDPNWQKPLVTVPLYSHKIPMLAQQPLLNSYDSADACFFVGKLDVQDGRWRLGESSDVIDVGDWIYGRTNASKTWHGDWHQQIGQAAFGLLPAPYETRGLIVQEIQALARIPVVDPHSSGTAAQVRHGIDGFCCDFSRDWRAQIRSFVVAHGPQGLSNIAQQARQQVVSSYIPAANSISQALIGMAHG